jgi:hypothetical protein
MALVVGGGPNRDTSARSASWLRPLAACPQRLRRKCLYGWLAVSLLWLAGLGALIGYKIDEHVSASHAVAEDIAKLDCPAPPARCDTPISWLREEWSDVVDVIWTFGAKDVLETAFLPPMGLFFIGGIALWLRYRRPRA